MAIWVDQYGLEKYRTIMISLVNLGTPVGYLLGFGLLIKGFFLIMFKFTDRFELYINKTEYILC